MISSQYMSFHEATVTKFCRYDATLELELEDVLVDGKKLRVVLKLAPVISMTIDGELSDQPLMVMGDGEVLSLDVSEEGISAVIEWNDFSQGKSLTKAYQVSGGSVSVSVI